MGMQNDTSTEVETTRDTSGGFKVGDSSADLIGFYGKTPTTQPTSGAQATITYTAGIGTASATSGLQALTSTYNSTLIANAIVTLAAQGNAIASALATLGIVKGS